MANFQVVNGNSSGSGSLAEAIAKAEASSGADTITFAPGVSKITTSNIIEINSQISFQGDRNSDGVPDVEIVGTLISGNTNHALFKITNSGNVSFEGLDFRNGGYSGGAPIDGPYGGAITNYGTVNVLNCGFFGNYSRSKSRSDGGEVLGAAGAIYNAGIANITSTLFDNNEAGGGTSSNEQAGGSAGKAGSVAGSILNGGNGSLTLTSVIFAGSQNRIQGGQGWEGRQGINGNRGGTGGNGGRGGDVAGAVLNEIGATMSLFEVTFGGFEVAAGDGGRGGQGGYGGALGGNGGRGGDGGNAGANFLNYGTARGDFTYTGSLVAGGGRPGAGGRQGEGEFDGEVGSPGNGGFGGQNLTLGTSGDDTKVGMNGDDVINGLAGADTLTGLLGNDRYIVDNIGDRTIEASNGGLDRVAASVNYVLTAGQEIEFLTTTDPDSTAPINLTGNDLSQTLIGNLGNNILDGGGSADVLEGAAGNDTYIVDDVGDRVIESAGKGNDTVGALTNYTLGAGQHVETLRLMLATGNQSLTLTGNELGQTLIGNGGNNTLGGGGGADTMTGGGGNDTYLVDSFDDRVIEAAGGGSDRVFLTNTFYLAAGQEVETLQLLAATGTARFNVAGNAFGQTIVGNAGGNGLDGKGGADILTGGQGADSFVFSTALESGNVDRITDFSAEDTIRLSKAVFTALATGQLAASAFKNISKDTADADDQIIYRQSTGELFYDADGAGHGVGAVRFAVLNNKAALTHADFVV